MENKENLENVVMDNQISSNEVNSPINEKIPSKNKRTKRSFNFKKKKANFDESISNHAFNGNVNNERMVENVVSLSQASLQNDFEINNNEVSNDGNALVNEFASKDNQAIEINDLPLVKGEQTTNGMDVSLEKDEQNVIFNNLSTMKEENQSSYLNNPIVSSPIFDSNAMEAATNPDIVMNKKEDNFVPPADFTSIFNVTSEETPVMPASVRLESDINKSVNSVGNNVTEANEIGNHNISVPEPSKIAENQPSKKEVFNSSEKVIYEIKPEKEGNPLGVIIFFLFLMGAIVILPYISKKFDYTHVDPPSSSVDSEEEEEDYFYFNRSSVRASLDGLEFTNFVKHVNNGEYFLTFNISNKNDRAYQYDRKYYVVFYDDSSIVYRALIHTYDVIGSNAVQEITLTINERGYKSADRFRIVEIPVSAYPNVEVLEKDGDYSVLTCNYLNDEIKYYFLENKLTKLVETYTETMEGSRTYENDKASYKTLSDSYKMVNNFTSTFVETNTRFTMINEFNHRDIADATLANLKTYKFFKYNENINTVSYELEAQGYTCG